MLSDPRGNNNNNNNNDDRSTCTLFYEQWLSWVSTNRVSWIWTSGQTIGIVQLKKKCAEALTVVPESVLKCHHWVGNAASAEVVHLNSHVLLPETHMHAQVTLICEQFVFCDSGCFLVVFVNKGKFFHPSAEITQAQHLCVENCFSFTDTQNIAHPDSVPNFLALVLCVHALVHLQQRNRCADNGMVVFGRGRMMPVLVKNQPLPLPAPCRVGNACDQRPLQTIASTSRLPNHLETGLSFTIVRTRCYHNVVQRKLRTSTLNRQLRQAPQAAPLERTCTTGVHGR